MPNPLITSIGRAVPQHKLNQEQILSFLTRVLQLDKTNQRKLKILLRASAIENRYSVLGDFLKEGELDFFPNENDHTLPSTSHRMDIFKEFALPLSLEAVKNALPDANKLTEITHLIVVSCTGMYAPGLDIDLVNSLGLKTSTQRICINFMGCYAAFNALKTAYYISKADSKAKILIVDVELCSIHIQQFLSDDQILSSALFADGAAAVLIESQPQKNQYALSLDHFYCDLITNGSKDMAWNIGDFGFEMRLSQYIPDLLAGALEKSLCKLLEMSNLNPEEIAFYAIHPGGKKIVDKSIEVLHIPKDKIEPSLQILKNYGNMSSVTILFVLDEILKQLSPDKQHKQVLAMAFGPGLTLETALLGIHFEG